MRFVRNQKQTDWKKIHRSLGNFSFKQSVIRCRYALIVTSYGLITRRQFEALRRFISRRLNKKGKYWRRTTLDLKLTKKAKGVRMGKGVGRFYRWVGYLSPGMILYEATGISSRSGKKDLEVEFKYIASKLPFKVRFVQNVFSFSKYF
jgi:ribosomal protein L16